MWAPPAGVFLTKALHREEKEEGLALTSSGGGNRAAEDRGPT